MIKVLQPFLLALFIGSSISCFSQERNQSVIASAGDVSKSSTTVLEWTVGESFTETVSSVSSLYTQGFHQPVLEVHKLGAEEEVAAGENTIQIFPNPTTAIINVQLDKPSEKPLLVSLMDVSGRILLNNTFPVNSSALKIDVHKLSNGAYTLQITDAAGTLQGHYKKMKAQ